MLACLPPTLRAAEPCPWLNAATAGGYLGGPITEAAVTRAKSGDDAACTFTRRNGALVFELRIEVETMKAPSRDFASYAARCRSHAMPLKAIGNEALACDDDPADGGERVAEQVVGRVRNRAFLVHVGTTDPSAQRSDLRDKARRVAEQVAGILF